MPTKINEYLAAGKAIVSTDLPTVCEFNETHQVLITSPPTPQDFLQAIETQLQRGPRSALRERRREVASHGRLEDANRRDERD